VVRTATAAVAICCWDSPAETDLTTVDGSVDAVATAERELGGLDVLVSNAGIGAGAPLKDLPVEDWDRV
jgi:NAD(P)-dependent dehydrogenase (short-subunit alcohol dehydrogenase family)